MRWGWIASGLLGLLAAACTPSKPPPVTQAPVDDDLTWLDPCETCKAPEVCKGWVSADDRTCARDEDCVSLHVEYGTVSCSWGVTGGSSAEVVASRAHEAAVRARLSKVDPCQTRDVWTSGGPCKAPRVQCASGRCRYANEPPTPGF